MTARLLLCVENFLLLPPFPVMPNAALLYVESSVRFLVKERDLSLKFLDSDFTSVRILGEGDGLLGAISGLCQCVSSHWLCLRQNPWWRRRASWSIFRNRSLCVCTVLALWQDNTELLLAVPEYAWFWLDGCWALLWRVTCDLCPIPVEMRLLM